VRPVESQSPRDERYRRKRSEVMRLAVDLQPRELQVFESLVAGYEIKTAIDGRHADGYAIELNLPSYGTPIVKFQNFPVMRLREKQTAAIESKKRPAKIGALNAVVLEALAANESIDVSVVIIVTQAEPDSDPERGRPSTGLYRWLERLRTTIPSRSLVTTYAWPASARRTRGSSTSCQRAE